MNSNALGFSLGNILIKSVIGPFNFCGQTLGFIYILDMR